MRGYYSGDSTELVNCNCNCIYPGFSAGFIIIIRILPKQLIHINFLARKDLLSSHRIELLVFLLVSCFFILCTFLSNQYSYLNRSRISLPIEAFLSSKHQSCNRSWCLDDYSSSGNEMIYGERRMNPNHHNQPYLDSNHNFSLNYSRLR